MIKILTLILLLCKNGNLRTYVYLCRELIIKLFKEQFLNVKFP